MLGIGPLAPLAGRLDSDGAAGGSEGDEPEAQGHGGQGH